MGNSTGAGRAPRLGALALLAACARARAQAPPRFNISTFAGDGKRGFSGDGAAATKAELSAPNSLAVEPASGTVVFSDSANNRVRVVAAASGVIDTYAGGINGAELSSPFGLAFGTGGTLFVADQENNRVVAVAAGAHRMTAYAGSGDYGYCCDGGPATAANLAQPWGLAVGPSQELYIGDSENALVRVVWANRTIFSFAGTGSWGYGGDGGLALEAKINYPAGLAIHDGVLFIADSDNDRVRAVSLATNIISTYAGNGKQGWGGDGGLATRAMLYSPTDVAFDSSGNLFVVDAGNFVLRFVGAASGLIATVAGTPGVAGYAGDGGAANASRLNNPFGVAVLPGGGVLIGDTDNNRVRRLSAS